MRHRYGLATFRPDVADLANHPQFWSWAFLAVAVWGALFTLNAHRPRPHDTQTRGLGLILSFFSAWLTTELVLHHLVTQVLLSLAFVALGALSAWPGWLGAGLSVLSWGGLWRLHAAAQADGEIVGAALREGLGEAYDEARDAEHPQAKELEWGRIAWPFGAGRRDIVRHRDLAYLDDGSSRHRLDVYHRRDLQAGAPVLIQIHGGAWLVGDKAQQGLPLIRHMAERGWLCVAINYGLSPRATWPTHLVDCKRALAWVKEHAAEYGGDPSCVVVTGGSAGGHLTAMMGLTANDPEFQPGFEEVDTSVAAFIPFYGVFDWTDRFGIRGRRDGLRPRLERWIVKRSRDEDFDRFDRASPLSRVHPAAPPAMVVHGTRDNLAPVEEARRFVEALREASGEPVVYVELPGAHHAFDVFASVRTLHAVHGVARFASWIARQHGLVVAQPASEDVPQTSSIASST